MHPLWKSLAFFSKLEHSMPYGTEISLLNIKPKIPHPICTIKDMYKDIHSSTVDNSENKCQWISCGTSHNRILYNMNVLYKMKVQSLRKILSKTKAIPQILLCSLIYFNTVKNKHVQRIYRYKKKV